MRTHPEALYWRIFLDCEYPTNYLDILLPEGVRQRIEYIKTYYQRTDERAEELCNRQRIYLTQTEMDVFIEKSAALIERKYSQLRAGQPGSSGYMSALELPE